MFTLAQPSYGYYNPYQELAMQQELQRRRQLEAYLRRQREAEEMERRRAEYEAAVRAEYERRREAELERRRQAELQRRRQAQQARGRHSMYDGRLESLFDALYGGQRREESRPSAPARKSPTPTPRNPTSTPSPVPGSISPSAPTSAPAPAAAEPEPEEEPQIDTAPSYTAVQSILAAFVTLQSEFTFPTQLDFQPGSSKLAYTPNNAPLHGYEHALTGLLTKLDAVESYGDSGVRKARKEAVKMIEKELERLDGMKVEAWDRLSAPQPETGVDPLSVPLPEDSSIEDEEMSEVEPASEVIVPEELPAVDPQSASEEPLEPTEAASTKQIEAIALPDVESSASPGPSNGAGIEPFNITPPILDTDPATLPEISNETALTNNSPNLEPLTRSLTSPALSKARESDSDLGLELGEYVDVESMSTSEAEDVGLEVVEKDGDLELMRDWDLDF